MYVVFKTLHNIPKCIRYESGNGNAEAVKELAKFITDHFIPSLKVISVHGGCCVTAKVKHKKINN